VTTPGGTTANVAADQYTYVAAPKPVITKISPTSGPTTGGTTRDDHRDWVHGATKVAFGTLAATSFKVVSSTQITAVSPAQAAGAQYVP